MEHSDLLAALERDGRALIASCTAAAPGTIVEACPAWTVDDLLWHVTEVHHFWRSIVAVRAGDPKEVVRPTRPADPAALPELAQRELVELLATLSSTDPATEVWTWSSQHDVAFVVRRMAQETAVHRWDADRAAGLDVAIDAELASDGIDEFLEHFIHDPNADAHLDGSVHIHCTDVAGEWTTRLVDGALITTREHAKGDCALRGSAGRILLALWRRRPLDEVDVVGDAAVAAQFVAYTNLD